MNLKTEQIKINIANSIYLWELTSWEHLWDEHVLHSKHIVHNVK